MPSCGVLPHADCTLSAEPGRSYELFFRHHAAGFFLHNAALLGSLGPRRASFTAPPHVDAAHGAGQWATGRTVYSREPDATADAGERRNPPFPAVFTELLVGHAAFALRVAMDPRIWRRPSLGSGSQSWRINLHPRAEYRPAAEPDRAGAGRCAAVSGRGAVRSAAAADELAVLAADNSPDDPAVAAAVRQSAAAVDEAANHPLTEAAAEFCGQGDQQCRLV